MKPNCQHWSECGIRRGGCCALGLYGGRPSFGVCASACDARSPAPKPQVTVEAGKIKVAVRKTDWQTQGPRMWAELHAKRGADAAWLESFSARIPCGECKRHWRELLKASPPDFTSDDAFYAWTVAAHNAVNERLGKLVVSLADAISAWRP